MKRIGARFGGLRGGLLPRESIAELAHKVNHKNFLKTLRGVITSRISEHLNGLNLEVVDSMKARLDLDWPTQYLSLAPGEEIVAAVFHHFGSEYKKPHDTQRIAQEMKKDEIADEIINLLRMAIALTNQTATNSEG